MLSERNKIKQRVEYWTQHVTFMLEREKIQMNMFLFLPKETETINQKPAIIILKGC